MESIAFYLLKSAAWLAGFTLVYLLFLRNERFFRLKRAYLVAGVVMSLLLPLITIHYRVELPAPVVQETRVASMVQTPMPAVATVQHEQKSPLTLFLWIYAGGMALFLFRALLHFFSLYHALRTGSVIRTGDAVMVRTEKYTSAFSFFNYVFINPSVSEQEAGEILNHEMVHLRQKHWFDLLLVEMMSLIQWMNPFVWIYSALVRQNHENLADEEALQSTSDPAGYRAALLNQVFNARLISLSNSFNFSFYTNRFEMMKKKAYSPYRKLKLLLVLPIMAIILYAFADPVYTYSDRTDNQGAGMIKDIHGTVVKEDGSPFPGVKVYVSGTSLSVTTDEAGKFYFSDLPGYVALMFTPSGYEPVSMTAESANGTTVTMKADPRLAARGPSSGAEIVVIDGTVSDLSLEEATKKLGKDYGKFTYLMPEAAKAKYGEKGAKGAFDVISRSKAREAGLILPYPRDDEADFPTFRGESYLAFADWVAEKAKYPNEAAAKNISGWARMSYTVETDGSVSQIKPSSDTDPAFAAELTRVMESSPRWKSPENGEANEPFTSEILIRFELPGKVSNGIVYIMVDEMPQFPGGDAALFKFLYETIKYPAEAKDKGIQGKVILRFIVTSEGSVENVYVVRGVDPLLDNEAVRVMNLCPKWEPGKMKGKPVNIYYSVPISFSLK
ncbi:MAG: TonB family protein [Bacteroidales bacterium]